MYSTYQLRSGDRLIEFRKASTARQALFDYLRSLGCQDEEIVKLGTDSISWRGMVLKAVRVSSDLDATDTLIVPDTQPQRLP